MSIEAIKTQLEVLGSVKVEFTPKSDEGNSIILPINDDYDGTFFTVIGCGDKQDNLGAYMASAVNELPDLISEIERLQRENTALKIDASNHAADAETVRREREVERRRAEAAEAEVKRYRETLHMIGAGHG